MGASLPTKPMYCSREYFKTSRLIQQYEKPTSNQLNMTHSVTLPGRMLAVVCVYNNLIPNQSGYIYEIKPSSTLYEKYPNICVIPMIRNVDVHKMENVPLVVIKLSSDEIYLLKGEPLGLCKFNH